MKLTKHSLFIILAVLCLVGLSCSLGGKPTPIAPTEAPAIAEVEQPVPAVATIAPPQYQELRQWATNAEASSEHSFPFWAASQATGEPNTLACGDKESAWASYYTERIEWITLYYEQPVIPTDIYIYQSNNPDRVVQVDVVAEPDGRMEVFTANARRIAECPYVLRVPVEAEYQTREIRVYLDQIGQSTTTHIDAVELVGLVEVKQSAAAPPAATSPTSQAPTDSQSPSQPPPASPVTSSFDPSAFRWSSYTSADGLPDNTINAIAFDKDGATWVGGAAGGISRFDGNQWKFYGQDSDFGISSAKSIAMAPDGTLWFATPWGLRRYDGQSWKVFLTEDGLVSNDVRSLAVASDGTLWIAASSGVSRFDGATWKNYTSADGLLTKGISAIALGKDGKVWVGTQEGVNRLDGGTWKTYTEADGLAYKSVKSVAVAPDGAVWFGTAGQGASRFDGSSWTTYRADDGLKGYSISGIVAAPDGSLWFSSDGYGAFRFDGSSWWSFTKADGLTDDWLTTVAAAPDGSLWFGVTTAGVMRFGP